MHTTKSRFMPSFEEKRVLEIESKEWGWVARSGLADPTGEKRTEKENGECSWKKGVVALVYELIGTPRNPWLALERPWGGSNLCWPEKEKETRESTRGNRKKKGWLGHPRTLTLGSWRLRGRDDQRSSRARERAREGEVEGSRGVEGVLRGAESGWKCEDELEFFFFGDSELLIFYVSSAEGKMVWPFRAAVKGRRKEGSKEKVRDMEGTGLWGLTASVQIISRSWWLGTKGPEPVRREREEPRPAEGSAE
ncbi:hypothetical protein CRG98_032481 [Punica granatum]|uniref:Uncharacterized protein n=1 Tax=Punica granatum TaxID=22663 RepID=A0A2I0IT16_PUNGR|nr:hypothetical protein CRG98_032481 [Punica granatum]